MKAACHNSTSSRLGSHRSLAWEGFYALQAPVSIYIDSLPAIAAALEGHCPPKLAVNIQGIKEVTGVGPCSRLSFTDNHGGPSNAT